MKRKIKNLYIIIIIEIVYYTEISLIIKIVYYIEIS